MAGAFYRGALPSTFLPKFLSMNLVMSGTMLSAAVGRTAICRRSGPQSR